MMSKQCFASACATMALLFGPGIAYGAYQHFFKGWIDWRYTFQVNSLWLGAVILLMLVIAAFDKPE